MRPWWKTCSTREGESWGYSDMVRWMNIDLRQFSQQKCPHHFKNKHKISFPYPFIYLPLKFFLLCISHLHIILFAHWYFMGFCPFYSLFFSTLIPLWLYETEVWARLFIWLTFHSIFGFASFPAMPCHSACLSISQDTRIPKAFEWASLFAPAHFSWMGILRGVFEGVNDSIASTLANPFPNECLHWELASASLEFPFQMMTCWASDKPNVVKSLFFLVRVECEGGVSEWVVGWMENMLNSKYADLVTKIHSFQRQNVTIHSLSLTTRWMA